VANYFKATHRRSYNFLLAGLLLTLYELIIWMMPASADGTKAVNLVDSLFDEVLARIPYGHMIIGGLMLLATIYFIVRDQQAEKPISATFVMLMLVESAVWAGVVFLNLGLLVGELGIAPQNHLLMALGDGSRSLIYDIGLSFGAGFYEELFFRLILVGAFQLLFRVVATGLGEWGEKALIVLLTAVLFSLAHHLPGIGEPFTWYAFMFRSFFGMMMSLLLLLRGFGVTAWTHGIYDVYVTLF
jgi:membrane protease YdiL (CAAX protease family)